MTVSLPFKVCPSEFYQFFTIHGLYTSQIIPLVYALLMGKKSKDYDDLFETLTSRANFDPDTILLDYEQATIKSVSKYFPSAIQKGTDNQIMRSTQIPLTSV